jgi:Fungal Zn(2)-Cys(6) binuclear cluster domain
MPASCEPCRRHKVRCDHKLPACTRCQQRCITSRCFYHPAPLTRSRALSQLTPADANPSGSVETVHTPSTGELHYKNPDSTPPLSRGYLGPISFAAEFVANSGFAGDLGSDPPTAGVGSFSQLQPYWLNKISDVLMLFEDFSLIERLVSEFYDQSPAPMIPAPFVRNAFPSTRKLRQKYLPGNITGLASEIINNTAKIFQIASSTQGCEFHELYTDANFRLEILGIMLAQAGRNTQFGTGSGVFTIRGEPQERRQFAQKMYLASDIILQVCKMLTPTNDLLVWLVYENMLLSSIIHGDSSKCAL